MKLLLRILFVALVWCCAAGQVEAQYFLHPGGPCPSSPGKITLDTIFYTPDTSMPFDKCFVLQMTLPGNPHIRSFAVNPVDRYGNLNLTRRDYRALVKSSVSGHKARVDYRKGLPFEKFKKQPLNLILTDVKSFPKATNTDVFLHIPPLEPNRRYQILLISDDNGTVKVLFDAGSLIFKSGVPPDAVTRQTVTQKLHQINEADDKQGNKFNYGTETDKLLRFLKNDTLMINQDLSSRSAAIKSSLSHNKLPDNFIINRDFKYVRSYRLFFKPIAVVPSLTQTVADGLGLPHYLEGDFDSDPQSVVLTDQLKGFLQPVLLRASDNSIIDFHKDGQYEVYLETYEKLINIRVTKSPVILASATLTFNKLLDLTVTETGKEIAIKVAAGIPNPDAIKIIPNTLRSYRGIESATAKFKEEPERINWNWDALTPISVAAAQCPCSNKGIRDLTQANDVLHILSLLSMANTELLESLRLGFLSSKDITATATKEDNITGRSDNLKYTMNQLQLLAEFTRILSSLNPANSGLVNSYNNISLYRSQLQDQSEQLDAVNKLNSRITANYQAGFRYSQANQISAGSTQIFEFLASNKVRIVPDFGFIAVFRGDNSVRVSDLAPYLGFNVNFRSIDKSIPMSSVLYKHWTHYLSFSAGLTLTSLAIPNKRTNLFGNNNLLTGFSLRLNNSLRITSGVVWFKTVDKNPLSTNQPLGFSPFAGVSLDLELQDLFGGISKLFKP